MVAPPIPKRGVPPSARERNVVERHGAAIESRQHEVSTGKHVRGVTGERRVRYRDRARREADEPNAQIVLNRRTGDVHRTQRTQRRRNTQARADVVGDQGLRDHEIVKSEGVVQSDSVAPIPHRGHIVECDIADVGPTADVDAHPRVARAYTAGDAHVAENQALTDGRPAGLDLEGPARDAVDDRIRRVIAAATHTVERDLLGATAVDHQILGVGAGSDFDRVSCNGGVDGILDRCIGGSADRDRCFHHPGAQEQPQHQGERDASFQDFFCLRGSCFGGLDIHGWVPCS